MPHETTYITSFSQNNSTIAGASSVWDAGIKRILEKKNLPLDLFHNDNTQNLNVDSDINEHAKWLFNNVYSIPYPISKQSIVIPGFARYAHGLTHVSRAAHYVPVFANLYRKHGVKDSDILTNEDIKLLQIAVLFHDAAREDENEDQWDHESALFLYHYLRSVLGLNKEKARLIAEATGNKDLHKTGYFRIKEEDDGQISWQFDSSITTDNYQKSIYHQLIHDVDCLDIIRARPAFDAKYLDFYQIAAKENPLALDELAQLICEARSLITLHGDSYGHIAPSSKMKYEQEHGFQTITQDIERQNYPVLGTLYKELLPKELLTTLQLVDHTPYDPQKELTQENLEAALREGKILARSMIYVSEEVAFNPTSGIKGNKTRIEIEKSMRRPGIATPSSKSDRFNKHGNPSRSVSLLGYGATVWSNVGFLMINPNPADIQLISRIDADTGYQKKSQWKYTDTNGIDAIKQQYSNLHHSLKLGGQYRRFADGRFTTHTELLYHCKKLDAIYFTQESTPNNPCSPPFFGILQAVYLRKEYEAAYENTKAAFISTYGPEQGESEFLAEFGEKKVLPIIEFSSRHNQIRLTPEDELGDELLIKKWTAMCSRYIRIQASTGNIDVFEDNLDNIKVKSMYYIHEYEPDDYYSETELQERLHQTNYYLFTRRYVHGNRILPADANYPAHLRERINLAIEQEKQAIAIELEDKLYDEIMSEKSSILAEHSYALIMQSPRLQHKLISTHGILEKLFNNLPEIPANKSDKYTFRPMIGAQKEILKHGSNAKDQFYGTPIIPNVCVSLDKQIKLIRALNLDMNECLYARINAENKLDREDIVNLVYGQCGLISMSEEPTLENQRTATGSQYIITENGLYYYDKLNEILHEIPLNESQKHFLKYNRVLDSQKLSFDELSRITSCITAYFQLGQFTLTPGLFSLILNKIKNNVFADMRYDHITFYYTYKQFYLDLFELLKLIPGGSFSPQDLILLEDISSEIDKEYERINPIMANNFDLQEHPIKIILSFFQEKMQKEQQSEVPVCSSNELVNANPSEKRLSTHSEIDSSTMTSNTSSFIENHSGELSDSAEPAGAPDQLPNVNEVDFSSTSKIITGLSCGSTPRQDNQSDTDHSVYSTIFAKQAVTTELGIKTADKMSGLTR